MSSKGLGLNAGAASFTPTVDGGAHSPPSPTSLAGATNTTAALPTRNAGVREDSFTDYAEMMDNIESAMEDEGHIGFAPESPAAAPDNRNHNIALPTSLPPHLQKHAQEFWFPECRDCSCCKGFKHGCRCAPSNGGVCLCATGGTPPPVVNATVSTAGAGHVGGGPSQWYAGRGINNNSGSGGQGRGWIGGGGRGRVPCKFFFSQCGCRYGDSCTFSHQQ
jgi:hypothetical protein